MRRNRENERRKIIEVATMGKKKNGRRSEKEKMGKNLVL